MNPSHVVYGACMRDCGVEGYGGPQGLRKLLDNGDFGLATWEHQSPSPLLRVLQCGKTLTLYKLAFMAQAKGTNFSSTNTPSLDYCKHPNSHQPPLATTRLRSFLHSVAASIPATIPTIP
ncbi:unnamed protein product [Prunus armeniaca]